jgi:transcriptional regulator with XRE-family HTH domain
MIFRPLQCRMARAALGWGVRELATVAKVSIDTVVRFERGDELKERTVEALQRAFETAGVEFMNGDRPGVRVTKATEEGAQLPTAAPKTTTTPKTRKAAKATTKKR